MIKAITRSKFVSGALVIGLAASAGFAIAAGPEEAGVVAGKPVRSNAATAASGRRPLAVRIAMADKLKAEKPLSLPADDGDVDAGDVEERERLLDRVKDRIASIAEPHAKPERIRPEETKSEETRPAVPRLLVECEESTVDACRGEAITWRIRIRNTGGPAHDVLATIFFAEGIEPTAATGNGHRLASGEVRFSPVECLGTDDALQFEVTGKAIQPGAVAYRLEVGCREVPGNVAREAVILVRSAAAN